MLSIGLGGLITLAILSTAAVTFFGSSRPSTPSPWRSSSSPCSGRPRGRSSPRALCRWADQRPHRTAGRRLRGLRGPGLAGRPASPRVPCRELRRARDRNGLFATIGTRPLSAILFAQAANGLLLPFVALALVYLMNRAGSLQAHCNGLLGNVLAAIVVAVRQGLGLASACSRWPGPSVWPAVDQPPPFQRQGISPINTPSILTDTLPASRSPVAVTTRGDTVSAPARSPVELTSITIGSSENGAATSPVVVPCTKMLQARGYPRDISSSDPLPGRLLLRSAM